MNEGREDKLPWTKWYWGDWEADAGLRSCGLAAQGLWQRMLSIMARSVRKGYLLDGEKQMESKTLAKHVGESTDTVESLLSELVGHGVPSISADGTIFNRRMVREASLSLIRSDAGKLGGRPKKQIKSKRESKTKAPSISISSSISDSDSLSEPDSKSEHDVNIKYYYLSDLLHKKITENAPYQKIVSTYRMAWASDFRLMVERDKVPVDRIEDVLNWATSDPFWKKNILSAGKFREQFGQLEAKSRTPVIHKHEETQEERSKRLNAEHDKEQARRRAGNTI